MLHDVQFSNIDLSGVSFFGAKLSKVDLIQVNLTDTNFTGLVLDDVSVIRCDAPGSDDWLIKNNKMYVPPVPDYSDFVDDNLGLIETVGESSCSYVGELLN